MITRSRASKRTGRRVLLFVGVGAIVMYLFDPRMGRARRAKLQDQLGGVFRKSAREAARKVEYMGGQIEGVQHRARTFGSDTPPPNDAALTAKIESEVLSRWNYPKGNINVNSAQGVVELRGVCETPEQINELEQEVRKISGVVDVHNYLHLPNTSAPNKQPTV